MAHSANLITTDDLTRQLGAPALRVFDCTTYLKPGPDGRYVAESGRANYDTGHIPGASYLDLQADLSDKTSPLRFTLPSLEDLTRAFASDRLRVTSPARQIAEWPSAARKRFLI